MTELRFDGRVAVITGAGNGLGRTHALELARRGAKVVVNDLGTSTSGEGADTGIAQVVADEIIALGGSAIAHAGDVGSAEDMQGLIDMTVETFGRLDILVNNAGIADGEMFSPLDTWDKIIKVNFYGIVNTMRSAWPHFTKQNFGRVVNTSSSSMLGTPYAGPYGAAKAAVVGLTKVVNSTYPGVDIKVNALMPIAWSRMVARLPEGVHRDWMERHFQPELVSAFLPVLCHEGLEVGGEVFTVGGGRAARVLFETTDGWWDRAPTAESFLEHFDEVMAGNNAKFANSGQGDLVRYVDWLGDRGAF